jgi:hypothetical protein
VKGLAAFGARVFGFEWPQLGGFLPVTEPRVGRKTLHNGVRFGPM